jgi:hypothetical protein
VSQTRTAEEVKQECLVAMGAALGPLYYALYNEFVWLHVRWRQYLQLFGATPGRVDLLNQAAGLFFRVVEDSLWEDTLLHLSRMTDTAQTGKKVNLTIQRLPLLITDQALASEVRALVHTAVTKSAFARDWRNRRIAHTDFSLAVEEGATPLAPGSQAAVGDALQSIDAVLNRLEMHFRENTVFFEGFGHPGDAESMLYVVRVGLEAGEARAKRLREGRPADGDFDSRPV